MTTNLKLSLAFAAAAICAGSIAAAQEDPMAKKGQSMNQPPAAAPATTTATDSKSVAQAKFDALDANHDGYIDKQEAAASKPLQKEFAKIDTNKDNKLSLIEFQNVKDLAAIKTSRDDGYQQ
jgi:EF-hand domain pair